MKRNAVATVALAVVVASLSCLATGRTRPEAWRVPIDYHGDAWYTLAPLRAAQDGHVMLGAWFFDSGRVADLPSSGKGADLR